jgi:hypothetical protein
MSGAIRLVGVGCDVRGMKDCERDENMKMDGEEEGKKKRKIRQKDELEKIKKLFSFWCSEESTYDHDQDDSKGH